MARSVPRGAAVRGVAVASALAVALIVGGCSAPSSDDRADAGAGRTIVVSPRGSDSATGTTDAPLRTPQAAVRRLGEDGGTIELADGTFARQRIILRGVRGVTVRAADGADPVLDGRGTTARVDTPAAIEIRDSSDVTVEGLDITGYRTSALGRTPIGVLVTGSGSDITLADNHVHDLGHDAQDRGSDEINAHGIAVYGTSPRTPISDLTIRRNEVDHLRLGASEAVVVNGNVDGWAVADNHVHDNDNIGIDAIGFETTIGGKARYSERNRARNGRITGNRVSAISADRNPAYASDDGPCHCADGIYVDGGRDIEISDNAVGRSDIGIEVAAEDPRGRTNGIEVSGNTITRSAYVGLAIGGYSARRGQAYDVHIADNVLRGNNTLKDGSPEILVQHKVHDSRITGNTVTSLNRGASMLERVPQSGSAAMTRRLVIDDNAYSSPASIRTVGFAWFGRSVEGFAAWRKISGQDESSTYRQR